MTNSRPQKSRMRVYNEKGERLYLNPSERARFIEVAYTAAPIERRFAFTLIYTGMRISEALSLTFGSLQLETPVVSVRTLKRREAVEFREIPMPKELVDVLSEVSGQDDAAIWTKDGRPVSRTTAYRWIKEIMAVADIKGPKASPKGLRHAFAVHALLSNVPLDTVQRLLGHASIETTTIYTTVAGPEQIELARRMWR